MKPTVLQQQTLNLSPGETWVIIRPSKDPRVPGQLIFNPPMSPPELIEVLLAVVISQIAAMKAQLRIWTPAGGAIEPTGVKAGNGEEQCSDGSSKEKSQSQP